MDFLRSLFFGDSNQSSNYTARTIKSTLPDLSCDSGINYHGNVTIQQQIKQHQQQQQLPSSRWMSHHLDKTIWEKSSIEKFVNVGTSLMVFWIIFLKYDGFQIFKMENVNLPLWWIIFYYLFSNPGPLLFFNILGHWKNHRNICILQNTVKDALNQPGHAVEQNPIQPIAANISIARYPSLSSISPGRYSFPMQHHRERLYYKMDHKTIQLAFNKREILATFGMTSEETNAVGPGFGSCDNSNLIPVDLFTEEEDPLNRTAHAVVSPFTAAPSVRVAHTTTVTASFVTTATDYVPCIMLPLPTAVNFKATKLSAPTYLADRAPTAAAGSAATQQQHFFNMPPISPNYFYMPTTATQLNQNCFGGYGGPQQQQFQNCFGGYGGPQQQQFQNCFGGYGGPQQQQFQNCFGGYGGPQQQLFQNFRGLYADPFLKPQQQQYQQRFLLQEEQFSPFRPQEQEMLQFQQVHPRQQLCPQQEQVIQPQHYSRIPAPIKPQGQLQAQLQRLEQLQTELAPPAYSELVVEEVKLSSMDNFRQLLANKLGFRFKYGDIDDVLGVHEKVGAGVTGAVKAVRYLNRFECRQNRFVMKQLPISREILISGADLSSSDIMNEINGLALLEHPNVMQLHEVFLNPVRSLVHIIMPQMTCSLKDMQSALRRSYSYNFQEYMAFYISHELLQGLAFLHANGYFHADIKPENVLVNESGEIKWTDFGLMGKVGVPENNFRGTFMYLAPEVANFDTMFDEKSDMWSLGILMFELVDGTPATYDYPFSLLPIDYSSRGRLFIAARSSPVFRVLNLTQYYIDLVSSLLQVNPRLRPTPSHLLENTKVFQHLSIIDNRQALKDEFAQLLSASQI